MWLHLLHSGALGLHASVTRSDAPDQHEATELSGPDEGSGFPAGSGPGSPPGRLGSCGVQQVVAQPASASAAPLLGTPWVPTRISLVRRAAGGSECLEKQLCLFRSRTLSPPKLTRHGRPLQTGAGRRGRRVPMECQHSPLGSRPGPPPGSQNPCTLERGAPLQVHPPPCTRRVNVVLQRGSTFRQRRLKSSDCAGGGEGQLRTTTATHGPGNQSTGLEDRSQAGAVEASPAGRHSLVGPRRRPQWPACVGWVADDGRWRAAERRPGQSTRRPHQLVEGFAQAWAWIPREPPPPPWVVPASCRAHTAEIF